jgi:hypothetical protein
LKVERFCLAARRTSAGRDARRLGRAGKQKPPWAKPRPVGVYGDCSGPAFRCGALRGGWARPCRRIDWPDDVLSNAQAPDGADA